MAEEKTEAKPAGKLPLKTMLVILGLLVAEGVAVVGVLSVWGQPSEVQGKELADTQAAAGEQMVEVLIVNDKFPNHHTGRVWLWEAEIQIKVQEKNLDYVSRTVEDRNAEIKSAIAKLFRTAHHNHLKEPNLETITRQLETLLREIFGRDADGQERVVAVLIPKCVGFPADF
ncbi:MAG: hypothetical protein VYC34_07110 [Planctomycetota bacterium]|nr:hypothetical protein [Planctomycetota bacterium]